MCERPKASASLADGELVPVILVVAAVLAEVDGGNLEDLEAGRALAVAAHGGGSPLVLLLLLNLGGGLGLLRLGEGGGCDGAQREEVHQRTLAVGRRHLSGDGGFLWAVVVFVFGQDQTKR